MKPRTNNTVNDIAKYVSLGYYQSAANCRVLLDKIDSLQKELNLAYNTVEELTAKTQLYPGEFYAIRNTTYA
jgi:hypothetical protein